MAFTYPPARRSDVVDEYHGTEITDPYRWLEDVEDAETKAFVAGQNEVSGPYLAALPTLHATHSPLGWSGAELAELEGTSALNRMTSADDESPLKWVAEIESPLTGPAGNKEFLVLLNR